MRKEALYTSDFIHCTCGHDFYVDLESSLVDEISGDSFENEMSDSKDVICPTCESTYKLEINVEKTIYTSSKLTFIGKRLIGDDGEVFDSSVLKGRWIGEEVKIEKKHYFYGITSTPVPDGVYEVDGKEYHVKDGVIENIWGVPDENQLSLFEECTV